MDRSTDIWFRTRLPLPALATELGAEDIEIDGEDTWSWVIGDVAGITIDITRIHTKPRLQTDTRIFRTGSESNIIPESAVNYLTGQLERLGISPVHVGTWVHRDGNEFDRTIHTSITGQPSTR